MKIKLPGRYAKAHQRRPLRCPKCGGKMHRIVRWLNSKKVWICSRHYTTDCAYTVERAK